MEMELRNNKLGPISENRFSEWNAELFSRKMKETPVFGFHKMV